MNTIKKLFKPIIFISTLLGLVLYNHYEIKKELKHDFLEENITINKIPIEQLKEIVYNGWNDSNQTLTNYIIDNAHKITKTIDNPQNIKNPNEYWVLFAYIKYLENQKEYQKAYKLYIDTLIGFENIRTNKLNLFLRPIIEDMICKSLDETIRDNIFPKEIRNSLKKELQKLLITDNSLFLEFIRLEFNANNLKNGIDKTELTPQKDKAFNTILAYVDDFFDKEYKKITKIMQKPSLVAYQEYLKQQQKERDDFYKNSEAQYIRLKKKLLKSHTRKDFDKWARLEAKYASITAISIILKGFQYSYERYFKQIKSNKILLEKL